MPTPEEFLAALKDQGYDGDGSLESVLQFIADEGVPVEFDGEPATDEQIAQVLGKAEDEDDDDEDKSAPKIKFKSDSAEQRIKKLNAENARLRAKQARANIKPEQRKAARIDAGGFSGDNPRSMRIRSARKGYEQKINKSHTLPADKRPAFKTYESAEAMGALLRFNANRFIRGVEDTEAKKALADLGFKAHTSLNQVSSGVLVPEGIIADIIDNFDEFGVARNIAQVERINETPTTRPSHGSALDFQPVDEAGTVSEVNMTTNRVQLTAHKYGAIGRFSSELMDDAFVNIGDEWSRKIRVGANGREDDELINGDGTRVLGLRNALYGLDSTKANIAGLVVGASGTATNWAGFTEANMHALIGRVPSYAAQRGLEFLCSREFFYTVMDPIQLAAGGTPYTEFANATGASFRGVPVRFSPKMPTQATAAGVVLLLGHFPSGVMFGDRRDLQLDFSEHAYWTTDEVGIRATERFAITVHDVGNASATAANRVAGPICGLASAS